MELRQRKKIRLQNRDYSRKGYYFITICIKDRWPILWNDLQYDPDTNQFPLSQLGEFVKQSIERIPVSYPDTWIDKYVIMPNHIHLILALGENPDHMRHVTVSKIVQTTKGIVTKSLGYSIWQKSFHDHIIRDESEYLRIWEYIETNPLKWQDDCYYIAPREDVGHDPTIPKDPE